MLTLSQQRTYQFIQEFVKDHDYSPTVSEIAQGTGLRSRGVIYRYLKALAQAGYIELIPKRHRNIKLLPDPVTTSSPLSTSETSIPLLGAIAAGQPIEAIEDTQSINLLHLFLGEKRYALKVKGDSMIDEGIFDGDIVVCDMAATADNGQIVVALIDQQEVTLKRFLQNANNTITLMPANTALQAITYQSDRITIQGVFIGLLRLNR